MYKLKSYSLAVFLSAFLFSCATMKKDDIIKTYETEGFQKKLKSVLIVSAGADKNANRTFENALTNQFKVIGVAAHSTLSSLAPNEKPSTETILALVKRLNVDGVLVTQLASSELALERLKLRNEMSVKSPLFSNALDFIVFEYTEIDVREEIDVNATVTIAADLYTIAEQSKVLSLETTSHNKKDTGAIAKSVSKTIVDLLQREKIFSTTVE